MGISSHMVPRPDTVIGGPKQAKNQISKIPRSPRNHMGVSHLLVCIKICKRGWSIAQQKIYFSPGLAFLGPPGVVSTYIRCGIIDFYGCWRGPEPVGALKRAEKGKILNLKKRKK